MERYTVNKLGIINTNSTSIVECNNLESVSNKLAIKIGTRT